MTFDEMLSQVQDLLQREKRVSYRGLKRRFALDDEYLEDLKEELIGAKRLATDEEGRFLVWRSDHEPTGISPRSLSHQSPPPSAEPHPPEAERRQLTVMFCDLVGSTALSEQLDPEELREVVQAYHETCAGAITCYAGYTAQHLGDGLLVYFGYPVAHEDEAARAVRTSFEILAGLHLLNARLKPALKARLPHPIQVRIGIHTGLVVIGEIGRSEKRELLALGETPNLAARLQGVAEPDTVVISGATQHLVQGLFEYQERGPQELKGLSTPVAVYRVVGESTAQNRFEAAVRIGLTPLVGREEELSLLQRRWMQAKEGRGQVVLLSGEAGIGKSRLVQAVKEQVVAEGATRIEFRCSPYHQNSALYPITDHLQRLLHFQREDSPQIKLSKLQQTLTTYRFPETDTVPLLATLLSLPQPEGIPPLTLSPQKQKQKTQEALVAWLMEEAQQTAVYCAWEDLHWADPSTLEVLTLFLEQLPTARVFSVLTFRPDFTPPWSPRSYLTQLTLNRLGQSHVESMIAKVTGGKALPAEIVQQIVTKTDGVPLFVEELTKMVLESLGVRGTGNGEQEENRIGAQPVLSAVHLGVPATLQDALMSRLDRLGAGKELAQVGAVLGREFSYELLHTVSPVNEAMLQQGLRQLIEAELIYQRGLPPQATYLFKHALIQDTAYQSLLKSKRQQLHQQIAQVLEERFAETVETQPELLAHHYTEARLTAQAIPCWQRAGERSVDRSAYVEAISHLRKGLELLSTLPQTVERFHQELNLQTPLGLAFMATKSYAAPEVGQAYTRARELCRQLGETPQLAPVLYGLWIFHLVRGELQKALEAAEQLLRLGQNTQDPALMMEGHHGLGQILFHMGQFASAQEHLEQTIALYDSRPVSSHAIRPVQDPGVMSRGYAAQCLWHLGYPDQAHQRLHEVFALAQELSHPFSFAFALLFACNLHQWRKEPHFVQERAETLLAFSSEHGFSLLVSLGTFRRGAILAAQGHVEEGLTQMRQSMDTYLAEGTELGHPSLLGGLAAVYGHARQVDEGLALLTEALALVDKTGQHVYEVGLNLLKGLLLLKSGSQKVGEAEECFRQALDVARRQEAKSLELQAAISLARLWQQQGKRAEAHKLLSDIYNWFTEGFDTGDLREAKALLDELS